ncbi:hypothetical protein FDJ44_gp36 [Microbacterium phage Pikmin]|uniref:Uncharacterized protein n=3 Tax=Pikminvirus pikmin TaxID=2560596 RepID=A0A2P1CKL1_9CAUD|nr:hypothetical protein FDJ44_gp36 [Microbacterium phage Pikmin]AVJ51027.1 hypothetical protein PBI_PAJAZA_36 [Microbacterium phage Pajaza]AVJ51174.1 hypothetical protein PBI_PIKMIN_36 [Microbacterium phage Pikmin]AVJ51732.1 hypothetical protein PBI_CASEY_36 [Microbacterium phage Casey]
MATKNTAAVLDEDIETTETEVTPKQIVNEGIGRVIEATGVDSSKARYKAMRAIAFQAFLESIDSEDFDGLVDRAIANADDLPAGWELERPTKDEDEKPAKKAPAKKASAKTAAKTPAKAPAKTPARRRPARKA